MRDVLGLLATGAAPSSAAAAWAETCNGCGACIPACAEGVNPRRMLVLANLARGADGPVIADVFRQMSRAIRLLAGMQVLPTEFGRLLAPGPPREVPVVFYVGCNAIRTPHIPLNLADLLDAVGIDYEIVGGPGACCGIIHARWEGALDTAGRVTASTWARFAAYHPERVLTWCPSCHVHLGETLAGFGGGGIGLEHVASFLLAHVDRLRPKLVHPVPRRVVLHAHVGLGELADDVAALLAEIPGLTIVDTVPETGYACGMLGCGRVPELQAREHARVVDRVRETGADTLVTPYHGCHQAFLAAESAGSCRVVNFTDLLVEALGRRPRTDTFKRFRLAPDARRVVEEGLPYLRANGIDADPAVLAGLLPGMLAGADLRGGLQGSGAAGGRPAAEAVR